MNARPLHDRIFVQRLATGQLSSTSRTATRYLFGKYSGQEVTLDGEQYLILREDG